MKPKPQNTTNLQKQWQDQQKAITELKSAIEDIKRTTRRIQRAVAVLGRR